jgi:cell division protein FtsW
MLASAGVVDGQKKFGDSTYYFKHQFLFGVLPGLALMFLLSKVDYKIWRKTSLLILLIALALLVLVFVPGIGLTLKGARSWILIHGQTFQPAEFLKLALVIYFSAWFGGKEDRSRNFAQGVIPFLFVLGLIGILLMLQPDLGTLGIVTAIALGLYFIAGIRIKDFAILVLIGVIILGGLVAVAPYRINRVKALFDPASDPRGISYQVNQSLIAIGSGGLFGVGYGHSTQKQGFLPETIGDSIFAVIVEELGLAGGLVTIGLFMTLCWFLVSIAKGSGDKFARLYVMGITIWIMSQATINIAAVSGIGPLTGLPLPFISYGGTALIMLLASLGIVFNIAKKA